MTMLPPIPSWLSMDISKTSKKNMELAMRSHHLKRSSFGTKDEALSYIKELQWPWEMPWRDDQAAVMQTFFKESTEEVVIQAIFGGGKTTMMLAIIYMLCLEDPSLIPHIYICAFNIGIRNELLKKTRKIGQFKVRTYDSLIWKLCSDLGYEDLKLLNFETKRRFVRENLDRIVPDETIRYVFLDESQDLEKTCYEVFKTYFPNARFMFVGDIFQSIQKEPRESLLWFLLNRSPSSKCSVFRMTDTPRVPTPILDEVREALLKYYPEFSGTITQWKSSSSFQHPAKISWERFQTYKGVYHSILKKLEQWDVRDTMVLTFSSAITVRGALGDIARFRRFLEGRGYPTNPNHKRMLDDRLFLSTANSSKGLERKHVLCIVTFPLELAFANFSNDLVMNLITVALSRCKEDVTFYVPAYTDRFSKVLECFPKCPLPTENPKKIAEKESFDKKDEKNTTALVREPEQECNRFEYDPTDLIGMLQKEHGVTEVLRQSILSFETRQILQRYAKTMFLHPLENGGKGATAYIRTEEECALAGVLYESMLLSVWSGQFPSAISGDKMKHHQLFKEEMGPILKMSREYLQYVGRHRPNESEKVRFTGCFLFAQLHLFRHQKIMIRPQKKQNDQMFIHWLKILPSLRGLRLSYQENSKFKTQQNVSMPFLNGIVDASRTNQSEPNEPMDIFEIKASRCSDWRTNALLQAILYGILSAKSLFNVYLVNMFSKNILAYHVFLRKDLMWLRNRIIQDILNWNMNCYLAKNVRPPCPTSSPSTSSLPILDTSKILLMDGRYCPLLKKWTEVSLCEFMSVTRTRLTILTERDPSLDHIVGEEEEKAKSKPPLAIMEQLESILEKYKKVYGIITIMAGPEMIKRFTPTENKKWGIQPFLRKEQTWDGFLSPLLQGKNTEEIKIDFEHSYNSLAMMVCSLVMKEEYRLI